MNFGILSKKRKNEIVNFLGVVNGAYYHLSYTVTRSKYFFLLIYTYDKEIFERLESKKKSLVIIWIGILAVKVAKQNELFITVKQTCSIHQSEKSILLWWLINAMNSAILLCKLEKWTKNHDRKISFQSWKSILKTVERPNWHWTLLSS